MRSVLEFAASRQGGPPRIGTLNEGALHAQLKDWYRRPGHRAEEIVDGFVVDLVRGDLLVEIQTGSFVPLRRKLELLLAGHRLRLVAPVPLVRRIVRLSETGELLSARRSPRRGRLEDVFGRLVSIPSLLACPQFELEVLLIHEDEHRVYRPGKAYRRHGWVVVGRRLVSVEQRVRIACPDDAGRLLPPGLPERFDSAQLAEVAGIRAPTRATDDLLPAIGRRPPPGRQTWQRDRSPPPGRRARRQMTSTRAVRSPIRVSPAACRSGPDASLRLPI